MPLCLFASCLALLLAVQALSDARVRAQRRWESLLHFMVATDSDASARPEAGWKMSKGLGYTMFALYFVFVVQEVIRQYS